MTALPMRHRAQPAHPPSWLVCLGLLVLGALATVGWAPLELVWVAWLAFAILAACIVAAPGPLQALVRCLCFAVGLHVSGHGWVFLALLRQTAAGPLFSFVGTALFLLYLASFLAVPALLCKGLSQSALRRCAKADGNQANFMLLPVLLAVAWTIGEAMRGELFNGFDSLAAGYLFTGAFLRGWVPVLGIYGCSLLFFSSAGLAGAAWAHRHVLPARSIAGSILFPICILVLGAWLGTWQWVTPAGSPLSFRLIQGGIPQQDKFDPGKRENQVAAYARAITARGADLIVTPETSFPVDLTELEPGFLARMHAFSTSSRSHVFLGMFRLDGQGGGKNSMVLVAPDESALRLYDKARLMPFGEYAPAGFKWLTQRMSVARNDLTAGRPDQPPFAVTVATETVNVATLTCHEDLSNRDGRSKAREAQLLINPSNLAWFAGTLALPQRLQIARLRALETGRPVLRATNTGITAAIDEKGRVTHQLPEDQAAVLQGDIQPTRGLTPFVRFAHFPALGLAAALLIAAALSLLRCRCRFLSL